MNAQQLKNAILQEAIEGRLVPQDPNDEPASVLLECIRKEKERLVKEGKLKKKDLEAKPISEDEIPFEIPESWEWVRLGNVCNDISDIDHKMPPVVENGIPYISPLNFRKDGSIDYVNAKKISIEDFKQLSRKCKPERDDLIFPRYGTIGVIRKVDTDTTTINQLTQKNFNRYLVPLPPLAEQKRIVEKIEELFAEIDKLKA